MIGELIYFKVMKIFLYSVAFFGVAGIVLGISSMRKHAKHELKDWQPDVSGVRNGRVYFSDGHSEAAESGGSIKRGSIDELISLESGVEAAPATIEGRHEQ